MIFILAFLFCKLAPKALTGLKLNEVKLRKRSEAEVIVIFLIFVGKKFAQIVAQNQIVPKNSARIAKRNFLIRPKLNLLKLKAPQILQNQSLNRHGVLADILK